jgi:hypothetical protein
MIFGILIVAAILVFYLGNRRVQQMLSARNTEPRGRRLPRSKLRKDPQFTAMVGRMIQRGLATPIARASAEPVLIRGVLSSADATLGGAPGRECVWQNRSGAPRDAAIAVDYVILADASGRATIENLTLADVVAPEDKLGPHRASCSLLLGDEVEVVARFKPERFGEDPDPSRLVYGTLGADGNLHVRVCKRDTAPPERADLPGRPALADPPELSGTTTS